MRNKMGFATFLFLTLYFIAMKTSASPFCVIAEVRAGMLNNGLLFNFSGLILPLAIFSLIAILLYQGGYSFSFDKAQLLRRRVNNKAKQGKV